MSAFSACLEQQSLPDLPQGDPNTVPERQHAWGEHLLDDEHGNPKFPEYQSFIFVDYTKNGEPSPEDRQTVEATFQSLEKAYLWGSGEGAHEEFFHDGIVYTIAYSPSYFERFDQPLPNSVDLIPPEDVLQALDENPDKADPYDAVIHLGTDYPQVLLAVELALFGELDELNGVEMEADFGNVFERRDRRAGFVGRGLPRKHLEDDRIHEDAAISMGFKSALLDNLPTEERVTISEGPFAGGTTQHISQLSIDLEDWYDRSSEERIQLMFSPEHSLEEVGETGEFLASDSRTTESMVDRTLDHAREQGKVGHTQKIARARDEDFEPRILRRGDFNAADPAGATLHFGSLQHGIRDIVTTLQAMYDIGFESDDAPSIDAETNGISSFLETRSRGNFLMPPKTLRALPPTRPES